VSRASPAMVATLVALGVMGATGDPAVATHTTVEDGNDTRSVLDVRTATVRHFKPRVPIWRIDTWNPWTKKRIWDRGFIFVYLDTRWDKRERPEHYVMIRSTGKKMQALLFRDLAAGNDRLMRSLRIWRWNLRRVAFKLKLSVLLWGPKPRFYRWSVFTTMTSEFCPSTCLDAVPNSGSVRQERG
jgi:hypothetical protein